MQGQQGPLSSELSRRHRHQRTLFSLENGAGSTDPAVGWIWGWLGRELRQRKGGQHWLGTRESKGRGQRGDTEVSPSHASTEVYCSAHP